MPNILNPVTQISDTGGMWKPRPRRPSKPVTRFAAQRAAQDAMRQAELQRQAQIATRQAEAQRRAQAAARQAQLMKIAELERAAEESANARAAARSRAIAEAAASFQSQQPPATTTTPPIPARSTETGPYGLGASAADWLRALIPKVKERAEELPPLTGAANLPTSGPYGLGTSVGEWLGAFPWQQRYEELVQELKLPGYQNVPPSFPEYGTRGQEAKISRTERAEAKAVGPQSPQEAKIFRIEEAAAGGFNPWRSNENVAFWEYPPIFSLYPNWFGEEPYGAIGEPEEPEVPYYEPYPYYWEGGGGGWGGWEFPEAASSWYENMAQWII